MFPVYHEYQSHKLGPVCMLFKEFKYSVQGYTVSRWQSWDSHTGNLTPEPAAAGHSHSIVQVTHIKAKDQRADPREAQSLTGTLDVMRSLAIVFRQNK